MVTRNRTTQGTAVDSPLTIGHTAPAARSFSVRSKMEFFFDFPTKLTFNDLHLDDSTESDGFKNRILRSSPTAETYLEYPKIFFACLSIYSLRI